CIHANYLYNYDTNINRTIKLVHIFPVTLPHSAHKKTCFFKIETRQNCETYAGFTCNSISIVMSSPTKTPPVSNVWFHVNPNSSREIFVRPSNPTTVTPHGLTPSPVRSTLKVCSFVVPFTDK